MGCHREGGAAPSSGRSANAAPRRQYRGDDECCEQRAGSQASAPERAPVPFRQPMTDQPPWPSPQADLRVGRLVGHVYQSRTLRMLE